MSRSQFALPVGVNLGFANTTNVPDTRNYIDKQTNQIQTGRYINPTTGDYTLSDNGHFSGFSGISTSVYLALATVYNSSTINGFGQEFFNIKMINQSTQSQATLFVNNALAHLVSNNQILINNTTTLVQNGQLVINIHWTDLTSNTNNIATIGGSVINNQVIGT